MSLSSRMRRSALAWAILAAFVACSSSDKVTSRPETPTISIAPKNAAVMEFQQREFEVWFVPSSAQASWQCILSDSGMGVLRNSTLGCSFTAAKGSHLGWIYARSQSLMDSTYVVVYGTGASR